MKKTNRTYQVFVTNPNFTCVLERGTKADMTKLFKLAKDNPEYECVMLSKWSTKFNCWYDIEKHYNY